MSASNNISTPLQDDGSQDPSGPPLNEREQDVLQLIVQQFVETAGPVGSRTLVKRFGMDLSPASVRNTMSDLEDMGYLDHPYTSAGRVPTELGYRTFVDELMEMPELSDDEKQALRLQIQQLIQNDTDELLRESSRLLGRLTNLLGIALSPRLSSGVLERLDIVPLSSTRLMFVLSVRGGLVKTIVLEFEADVKRSTLDRLVSILNERLAGLTLEEIRNTHEERVRDIKDETGIVRLILDKSSLLFSESAEARVRYGGTQNILTQPEFQEPDEVRRLMEIIEDEGFIVEWIEDLFDAHPDNIGEALVRIGSENSSEEVEQYSLVLSPYQLGDTFGTLGVIGPTRMNYARVMALVEKMAEELNRPPQNGS